MADETSMPEPQRPRGWQLWGTLSAVLVIAAAIVVFNVPREPESVAHLRAFLTAIREGRVDDAFALAGIRRPSGDRARFLTPKALSDDWEIVALNEELHLDAYPSSPEEAHVEVAIRVPGGATAVSELTLLKQAGKWSVEHPLIEVTFPATTMLYVDVNGVKEPTEVTTSKSVYSLLPGAYRFYREVPGLARVDSTPLLLLPGSAGPGVPSSEVAEALSPAVTLTEKGERAAQAALKAYIDECARTTELDPASCPFGADRFIGPQGAEYRSVSDLRDVAWKVEDYPEAAIITGGAIRFADRQRGSVKVTVTATEDDSRKVRYSVTCQMRLNGFELAIGHDGKPVVLPPYARHKDTSRALLRVDSCPR